jgi:hypothetical protein
MDVVLAGGKIKVMFERRYTSKPIRTSLVVSGGCVERCQGQDDVAQLSLHLGVDLHVVTRRSSKRS